LSTSAKIARSTQALNLKQEVSTTNNLQQFIAEIEWKGRLLSILAKKCPRFGTKVSFC
jgi:hypothetical protein